MIITLILLICCCFSFIIFTIGYDSYNAYSEKPIKSFSKVKDFLKFIYHRIKLWVECNILSLYKERYKSSCYTGAVILTSQEEAELDSATPGSFTAAYHDLMRDKARQTEDYERANEALGALGEAMIAGDAYETYTLSDEVEMDEEALYYRAYITAQEGQMTHNLTNMEVCGADGNVVDYMDLAATGLDLNGQLIPDNSTPNAGDYKSGKNFRWSNRCKNTPFTTFGYFGACDPELTPSNMPVDAGEHDWINEQVSGTVAEKASSCSGSGCLDSTGTDVRIRNPDSSISNDIRAFSLGNFSGWTCNHYAKNFCKGGKPDLDNHADMFGIQFNWPELNCCACGGGSRKDVTPPHSKQKYEFIHSDHSNNPDHPTSICPPTNTLTDCINLCTNDPLCIGLQFPVSNISQQMDGLGNYHHVDPSSTHGEKQKGYKSGDITFIHKPDNTTYSDDDLRTVINRNSTFSTDLASPITGNIQQKTLKKLPLDFQNIDGNGLTNSEITNANEHHLPYDKIIKNNSFGTPFNNCETLCPLLDDYRTKEHPRTEDCDDNCKRSDCCELNTCANINCTFPYTDLKDNMDGIIIPKSTSNIQEFCCAKKYTPQPLGISNGRCRTNDPHNAHTLNTSADMYEKNCGNYGITQSTYDSKTVDNTNDTLIIDNRQPASNFGISCVPPYTGTPMINTDISGWYLTGCDHPAIVSCTGITEFEAGDFTQVSVNEADGSLSNLGSQMLEYATSDNVFRTSCSLVDCSGTCGDEDCVKTWPESNAGTKRTVCKTTTASVDYCSFGHKCGYETFPQTVIQSPGSYPLAL